MTNRANDDSIPAERRVRPIGAWVVAAFLLLATLTMWTVVSLIFCAYS
jgi:hypothetical protein